MEETSHNRTALIIVIVLVVLTMCCCCLIAAAYIATQTDIGTKLFSFAPWLTTSL